MTSLLSAIHIPVLALASLLTIAVLAVAVGTERSFRRLDDLIRNRGEGR